MAITHLVAIAGGTCAGKTRLSECLYKALPCEATVLSQDSFYPDRSTWDYWKMAKFNWDKLESFDVDHIYFCLRELISGRPVSVSRYDHVTHAIDWDEVQIIMPVRVLIFEGLHAIELAKHCLRHASGHAINLTAIFIDCEEPERRRRRMRRELCTKTVPGDFAEFWRERCEPTFQAQVLPQRRLADLVVRSPWTSATLTDLLARIM